MAPKLEMLAEGTTHTMLIDVHAHAQPPEYLDLLVRSGRYDMVEESTEAVLLREKNSGFPIISPRMPDIRERIAEMDRLQIDVQVLSLSVPQVYVVSGTDAVDFARHCNDYLASMVKQYPDRFRALASIPLTAETIDDAVRELARCVEELGMVGFTIGTNIDGAAINDRRFDPFFEEANRLGTTMFIHPMVPAGAEAMNEYHLASLVGYMFETTLAVSQLMFSNFFGRFLGINVVVAHMGGSLPYLVGRLDAGYRAYPECRESTRAPGDIIRDLYVDTVSFHAPAVQCAIDTLGVEHVLFGTDYPNGLGSMTDAVDLLEEMGLGRRDKRGIYSSNAAPLYGITTDDGPHLPFFGSLIS